MISKLKLIRRALRHALECGAVIPELQEALRDNSRRIRNLEFCLDALIKYPEFNPSDHWALNSQQGRRDIVSALFQTFHFDAIVETGTFMGESTAYLATSTKLPVFTCESNDRFLALARKRLQGINGITFFGGDSREFLRNLALENLGIVFPFIYLDAHWYGDLPLKDEVEIIDKQWSKYIVLVDDFHVPDDSDYGFDDYGPGKTLDESLLKQINTRRPLALFYPSLRGNEETGGRRGCVIITADSDICEEMESIRLLRRLLIEA